MLQILFVWILFFVFSYIIGAMLLPNNVTDDSDRFMLVELIGIIALTVYAQIYSLIMPVKSVAALGILALSMAIILLICRKTLFQKVHTRISNDFLRRISSRSSICNIIEIVALAVLFILFLKKSALMPEHYDTYLYHCQAVRWIEEYGIAPGISLINSRIGFNSSLFSLYALFGFKDVFGETIHAVGGGIAFVVVYGAIRTLDRDNKLYRIFVFAILLYYIKVNDMASLSTDFIPNILLFAVALLWIESKSMNDRANLSMIVIGIAAMKLSFAVMCLLAVYPCVEYVINKKINIIFRYAVVGFCIFLPFLIRNYFISGWLIYPFEKIDIFSVDWKASIEQVVSEKSWVTCWARKPGTGSWDTLSMSFNEWVPIWWKGTLSTNSKIILAATAISSIVCACGILINKFSVNDATYATQRIEWSVHACLLLCLLLEILYWFLSAPDLRFIKMVFFSIITMAVFLIINRIDTAIVDNKITACICYTIIGVILLACCKSAYKTKVSIVEQQPYRQFETETYEIDCGMKAYYPIKGDQVGYYDFPGATYVGSLRNIELRGMGFDEGFRYKK